MKIIIFIYVILISHISAQCFYHPNNILSSIENIECTWDSKVEEEKNNSISSREISGEVFKIQLSYCDADSVTCDKVLKEFYRATNLIASIFIFNTQIYVNVSYYDLCTVYPDNICNDLSGAAYPTQFYLLQDDDGMSRLYPQSLVKQFQFPNTPKFKEFDISAEFNSKGDFWFQEDLSNIKPGQGDIFWTICHELMHGLGFYNGWMGYKDNPIAVIPLPVYVSPDGTVPKSYLFSFDSSFVEFMMDKYTILLSNGTQISIFTQQLNTFFDEYKTNAFSDEFVSSPQFKLAQDLLVLATTPKSLGLLPRNSLNYSSDSFILETSIPFEQGSSLIHPDYKTYISTSDFLMTYKIVDGVTTDTMILNNGNYSGGPIGPKLKQIMETFGYTTADNPNPYRPQPFKPPPSNVTSRPIANLGFKLEMIRNLNILIIGISLYFQIHRFLLNNFLFI
ncbi:hypothetical protein RclHR1_06150014 [Rhizophagus clarus]|uniref:Sequence orphan n=1 Tax=Rhizophagus clarus TaxID=94130 RepID=A0A2Z6RQF1_9GLOM|nr:hypothetical protein RclHR1_06150014 [Rhizophagus clarus]